MSKHGHKGSEKTLNTEIELSSLYLRQAIDLLLEFGVLLVFSLWRKHFTEQEQDAFSSLNQVSFDLIKSRNYVVAIRVLEYGLGLKSVKILDRTMKMMVVNLASAYRHSKDEKRCLNTLASVDWSGSADEFKICAEALKVNVPEVVSLMGVVSQSNKITKENFRDWPVFDFVKDQEEFCAAFLSIFTEPFREESKADNIEFTETNEQDVVVTDGATLH